MPLFTTHKTYIALNEATASTPPSLVVGAERPELDSEVTFLMNETNLNNEECEFPHGDGGDHQYLVRGASSSSIQDRAVERE